MGLVRDREAEVFSSAARGFLAHRNYEIIVFAAFNLLCFVVIGYATIEN